MNVLEAIDVTKLFDESAVKVQAVRGIDLSVHKGEMLAIVGPSGSGKSTLLSLLGAIETPTSGKILLEGVDLATLNDKQRTLTRRHRIGFVFQAFNLLPTLTALENVALPMELDGMAESEANERAAAALDVVGLAPRRNHVPSMLSGGEQQRVAVARALSIRPAVLLADEPTGNLDSVGAQQVLRLLRDLVDNQGQSVVIVTHDMQIAGETDRIVRLRDGLVESEEVLRAPFVQRAPAARAV
jgi:putative ABC transport system ATP-binding protein